jgi:hypothetical protein
MSAVAMPTIATSEIVAWFQEAVKRRAVVAPDVDSPYVEILRQKIEVFRNQLRDALPPEEQARLIAMADTYQSIGKQLIKVRADLAKFRARALVDLSEDDRFIETIDRTMLLIDDEWIRPGYASNGRAPVLWHQWAAELHNHIVAAWAAVGASYSSINANNPPMRVLKRALNAIDGTDRDEKTIEQALRRPLIRGSLKG